MAGESEVYQHEALADEERKYLRRQKPLEVRRRRFGKTGWSAVGRWVAISLGSIALIVGLVVTVRFFLYSPTVTLASADQIEVTGNHFVSRALITERFAADLGRSVMRVPLDSRRQALENIPWIADATVQRVLPGKIHVEITERVPIAFLRTTAGLALVDGHGVILERPIEAEFHFPVITGLTDAMPQPEREQRMKMFQEFLRDADLAHTGAGDGISEIDLSDAADLRATITGLPGFDSEAPLVVRFGDQDYVNKFRLLVDNAEKWRERSGRIESIDLRFARQVVVNPEQESAATLP